MHCILREIRPQSLEKRNAGRNAEAKGGRDRNIDAADLPDRSRIHDIASPVVQ